MRPTVFLLVMGSMLAAGCGSKDADPTTSAPSAGSGGAGAGGPAGSGGASGSAGSAGTAGSSGTGGIDATAGTGGHGGAAGSAGSAGAAGMAGASAAHQGETTNEDLSLVGEDSLTENFGFTLALDGDTLVVSGNDGGATLGSGAAHVFVRDGASWTLQQTLVAPDPQAYDGFGTPVCISGDTILVSGKGASQGGAVFVFVRDAGTWTLQQELAASDDAPGLRFGAALALDGDTAVIGAPNEELEASGAAYVFTRSSGSFSEQARLVGSLEYVNHFGRSVAVSGDTVLVGSGSRVATVAAYVFGPSGGSWSEQARLMASDAEDFDRFASSVALSFDTAVVGAPGDDDTGSAYVFTRSGAAWSEPSKLRASDATARDDFAGAVAIDADTVVLGAAFHDDSGAAYVFERTGTSWTEAAELRASDGGNNDQLGTSIAIAGSTVVAGAPIHTGGDSASGAAYVFELP